MKLDYDILCAVMEFVADDKHEGVPTIAAISRTCKRMRFEGAKHLLSGVVEVFWIESVCSFCHFMLADRSTRLPLLKCLVLRLYRVDEDVVMQGPVAGPVNNCN